MKPLFIFLKFTQVIFSFKFVNPILFFTKMKRLICERYYNNDKIPYKIEIYNKEKKNTRYGSTWIGVLLCLLLITLIIVFIASLFLLKWKRPGLYLEDCNQRSCVPGLGLKCINSICQCPSESYYSKQCLLRKSYHDFCHNAHKQCESELICLNGKCTCNQTQFWTGLKCLNRASYSQSCETKSCLDSLFLICNSFSKVCVCDSTRF